MFWNRLLFFKNYIKFIIEQQTALVNAGSYFHGLSIVEKGLPLRAVDNKLGELKLSDFGYSGLMQDNGEENPSLVLLKGGSKLFHKKRWRSFDNLFWLF